MNERIPPHNIEAEQAVIGAIFLEPNAFSTASERIESKDFYRANHQVIFEAMFDLFEKGEPIDMVTVTTLLSNSDKLEIAGGVPYLTDVAGSVPTAANKTISFMSAFVIAGDINVPKIDTDWVPTAAINQAPLIPLPNEGLFFRIVIDVKNVYITSIHKNIPIPHSMDEITTLFVIVYT